MKTSNKKALILIGIILFFSILNFFIPIIFSNQKHIILLGCVIALLYSLLGINFTRNSNDIKVIRDILMYVIGYYVIIYSLGFFIGFARSVYNYTLSSLILNIIPSILTIIAVEIIRGEIIHKTSKNRFIALTSCFVFIVFEISVNFTAYDLYIRNSLYQFIGLLVMGSVTNNILLTIMHHKTDKYPAMIYRFAMETTIFIILVEPNLGPYLKSVGLIVLPALISIMLLNMDKKVQDKPKEKKKNSRFYIAIIAILLVIVLLNSGLFKYQTLVIGSDSMAPHIKKGDIVFIDHTKNHNRYHVGDILAFKYNSKVIVHRIISKEKRDGKIYYKTKGDNNDQADLIFISEEQMKGKILFRIKYIGLPSVWLSELFD